MAEYGKLNSMQAAMARKMHLQQVIDALEEEHGNLIMQMARLNTRWVKEENDVQKTENGISGLMWSVFGRKEEKLNKERREAYAAKVRYDSAVTQMEILEKSIKTYIDELESIEGRRQEYMETATAEMRLIRQGRILTEDDKIFLKGWLEVLRMQNNEIQQALDEGEKSVYIIDDVLKYLDKAQDMCTADFFMDNILVDMGKHENLDNAQQAVYELQAQLRKFRSKLVDVNISADVQVDLDEFTKFADIFWDNWFTDWDTADKVNQSIRNVRSIRRQVEDAVKDLLVLKSRNENEQNEIQAMIEKI